MALFEIVIAGGDIGEIEAAAMKVGYALSRVAVTGSGEVRFRVDDQSARFERGREIAGAILLHTHGNWRTVSVRMAVSTSELSDEDLEEILSARYGEVAT